MMGTSRLSVYGGPKPTVDIEVTKIKNELRGVKMQVSGALSIELRN